MASILDISQGTAHDIIYSKLGFRKVSSRWVPKQLSDDHKLQRLIASQNLLNPLEPNAVAPMIGPNGETLPQTPHSPDLAPSDFHLFGPLKRHLGGQKFVTDEALISEVRDWMAKLDGTFFREGIHSLAHRWQKCIDLQGDYIAK